MNRRLLGVWIIAAAALALPANADIMYWYWQVEVNGEAVDATVPVVVGAGDQVDIELWAEFDPFRGGFAASDFAIDTGDRFFQIGDVSISEADGFGRNPALRWFNFPGTLADTDGEGTPDIIDSILVFQAPQFFNAMGDWRDPLPIYSMRWDLFSSPDEVLSVHRVPTLDGELSSIVYEDIFGNSRDYLETRDVLRFIPTTPVLSVVLAACAAQLRRTRAHSC